MQGKLVIVCIDQAARPVCISSDAVDSKKSKVKFGNLAPTAGSAYVIGWTVNGGNWSLGNGISQRVDALREELVFRSETDPTSLSADEKAVLAMRMRDWIDV